MPQLGQVDSTPTWRVVVDCSGQGTGRVQGQLVGERGSGRSLITHKGTDRVRTCIEVNEIHVSSCREGTYQQEKGENWNQP